MSLKFSSFTNFFSRTPHKSSGENQSSASQFFTLTSNKPKKSTLKESRSKIARFFHKLFQSKENAREVVDKALASGDGKNRADRPVKKNSNSCADFGIDDIIANTPGHIKSLTPEEYYAEFAQRRNFMNSNEGLFMMDITNMGSCVKNPEKYFRVSPAPNVQTTISNAFQIYYEERKPAHEDSLVVTDWGYDSTAKSAEDLEGLKADLKKISARGNDGQELIQKAMDAIEGRIARITQQR